VLLNFGGKQGIFLSISGKAKLIRNKKMFEQHWVKDLDQWFQQGVDTPGLVLIQVKGKQIRYWEKGKEGKIDLGKR
jgi:general stress protein 26